MEPGNKRAGRGKPARKLRRGRSFADSGPIQSRLPTVEAPSSRQFVGGRTRTIPASRVVTAISGRSPDELANHIVCGDAASGLQQLPGGWCACAVTSPPYWNTVDYGVDGQIGSGSYEHYLCELDKVWSQVDRVLIPNGKLCVNVPLLPLAKEVSEHEFGHTHTRILVDLYSDIKRRIEQKTEMRLFSLYIWEKQTTEKMFGSYPFPPNLYERNYIEFIAVFVKPGAPRVLPPEVKAASKLTQEDWMDLTQQIWWMFPDNIPRLEGHPAPFPEALPNRLISMYSFGADPAHGFRGDIILDPFCGSGTTCVAAHRLGRRYIGIDLNDEFCRFAENRIAGTPINRAVMTARRPREKQAQLFGS